MRKGSGLLSRVVGFAMGVATRGLLVVTGYLAVLTVAAATSPERRRRPSDATPTHRLAVLVPAHDEAAVIVDAVASLRALDYPAELLSIHVVADNCTDATAELARIGGADVHERVAPDTPGKGPALQWLLARLDRDGVDAFVFVDADTTVAPDLARVVDDHLRRGADVVQAHYAVRDDGSSPTVAFRAAAFAARTFVRPLGRTAIGGSAGLHGNGMAFRAGVMAERRWSDHLTEDVELHLDLLLDGTLVAFAPTAKVEAEMPDTLEAARTQNERWERGRLDLVRRYGPTLARRAVTGGPAPRVAYVDALLDQLVPPFSVVVAGTGAWTVAAVARAVVAPTPRHRRKAVVAAGAAAAQAGYVLGSLALVGAPASVYRSLLQAPRMVAWKLGLWLRMLRRPTGVTWTRTARN